MGMGTGTGLMLDDHHLVPAVRVIKLYPLQRPQKQLVCSLNHQDDVFLWIPDEYTKIVNDMRKANIIKDNRVGLIKMYKNSFKGQDFIDWIMKERGIKKSEALEIGQELIDRHFGQQTSKERGETFSPDRYYQLVEDDENKPLNAGQIGGEADSVISVDEFNTKLVKIVQPIYDSILSDDKQTIHYHRLVDNEHFNQYLSFIRDLSRVDLTTSTIDQRLALMINVYNMMTIHITQRFGPPVGVWQRRKVFNSTYYIIGGHNYSLNSILNGVLRGNRKGNGYLWKPFGKQDLRLPLVIENGEPLAFFGINIGTRHSPPLRVYSTNRVREELIEQVHKVLDSENCLRFEAKKNVVLLSKIFKWHSEDFGNSVEKILEWVVEALQGCETEKAKTVTKMFFTGEYKVAYIHYDWAFNGIERNNNTKPKPKLERLKGDLASDSNSLHTPITGHLSPKSPQFDFESSYRM
ncbi:unnamed protein product, partial [Mesorhabditis belari]|uniref:DEP domain-containing protein n=1 Tax=Mesorhabditis belari TaxID=2138241 RepID=A0AAF3J9U9_9BILA